MSHKTIVDNRFLQALASGCPLILDGGLATELENQGQVLNSKLWSARILADDPDSIIAAHLAYLHAGAQIITSASYQASVLGFIESGLSQTDAENLIVKAVSLAIEARRQFIEQSPKPLKFMPLVAASIGPYGAYLADGSEYTGDYDVDEIALKVFHQSRMTLLDNSEASILACETIPSFEEACVLHDLLLETTKPAWISFSCKDDLHINDGTPVKNVAALFNDHPNVAAVGINCTPPQYISGLIEQVKTAAPDKAVIIYPNSGQSYSPQTKSWNCAHSSLNLDTAGVEWMKQGANIIGGCCQIGPKKIIELASALSYPHSPC